MWLISTRCAATCNTWTRRSWSRCCRRSRLRVLCGSVHCGHGRSCERERCSCAIGSKRIVQTRFSVWARRIRCKAYAIRCQFSKPCPYGELQVRVSCPSSAASTQTETLAWNLFMAVSSEDFHHCCVVLALHCSLISRQEGVACMLNAKMVNIRSITKVRSCLICAIKPAITSYEFLRRSQIPLEEVDVNTPRPVWYRAVQI